MADIDVGPGNIVPSLSVTTYTRIERTNPANDSGVLDTMFVEVNMAASGIKIGTFDSGTLIVHDFVLLGGLGAGERTITGISCDVNTGDYIGTHFTGGTLGSNTSGSGTDAYSGDGFDGNSHSYKFYSGYQVSVGATGETVEAGGGALVGGSALVGGQILCGNSPLIN